MRHPLIMEPPRASRQGSKIAINLEATIRHFFPDLETRLDALKDPRKNQVYSMAEIVFAAVSIFMLRQDSRNSLNNKRSAKRFSNNFKSLFGLRLPHLDTVNDVMRRLEPEELERLKAGLIRTLIEGKMLARHRFLDNHYLVAFDATGVMSVREEDSDGALHKTSKNGVKSYFRNVLEAKLITSSGFAISLASEWLENAEEYDKQDCELKAFDRLAAKVKKLFPRLPICVLADGLYPNKTVFDLCKKYDWRYVITLKDKSLKSVWEELDLRPLATVKKTLERGIKQAFQWTQGIEYNGHKLGWLECVETKGDTLNRFVYVTDVALESEIIDVVAAAGRLRFKIENEGFNTQKNLGLSLGHKFSRTSYKATKNYYQAMQIAHLLLQVFQLSTLFRPLVKGKMTIKALWERLTGSLTHCRINAKAFARFQVRYE